LDIVVGNLVSFENGSLIEDGELMLFSHWQDDLETKIGQDSSSMIQQALKHTDGLILQEYKTVCRTSRVISRIRMNICALTQQT